MENLDNAERLEFFKNFELYQAVVRHDYMYHRRIIENVKKELLAYSYPSILELGCGDAYVVSQSINAIVNTDNITDRLGWQCDYSGIDQSEHALALASDAISPLACEVTFYQEDMLQSLAQMEVEYDVIIAGYCIHHLDSEQKQSIFKLIRQRLSNQGVFVFYDIERLPDESVIDYNQRACQFYQSKWVRLSNDKISRITDHVLESDIPETEDRYRTLFEKSEFNYVTKVFSDSGSLYSFYLAR
ncbi:MAG: methyltransferase domain-containing protein [Cellvibrionales bacterium]|nr:methyltransferase domain-containing protein [Cellvibrionales bacterium]